MNDDGTIEFSFSSELPVDRWFGAEILVHDADSADLDRIGHAAVLLFHHGRDYECGIVPIGKIERVWRVESPRKMYRVQVTPDRDDERSARIWKKWDSDQIRGVSFGYSIDWDSAVWVPEGCKTDDGRFEGPALVCYKWQVFEISIEPIPADPTVGKGRALIEEGGKENDMEVKTEVKEISEVKEVNVEKEREEAAKLERARVSEINAICKKAEIDDETRDKYIKEAIPVEDVRKAALDALVQKNKPMETAATVEVDEKDKFRAAAIDAMLFRGLKAEHRPKKETLAVGALDLMSLTPREMARECLIRSGLARFGDIRDVVGRALVSTDLSYILGAVANKSLMAGWDSHKEQWRLWCDTIPVPDFKPQNWLKMSEFDDLEEVKEYGEFPFADIPTESAESFKILTFGKRFGISRQAIINDDLNALTRIPGGMGESSARKLGDLPWAILTANGALGDGVTLFHADHSNLLSALAPTSVGAFDAAELLMMSQTDLKGERRLSIMPEFFLAPIALKGSCESFFQSKNQADKLTIGDSTVLSGGEVNTHFDEYNRIYEPRLDDASTTNWFMAGPRGKTVIVGFLDGKEEPYFEEQEGWSRDGIEYKIRMDACAFAADHRALVKNPYGD